MKALKFKRLDVSRAKERAAASPQRPPKATRSRSAGQQRVRLGRKGAIGVGAMLQDKKGRTQSREELMRRIGENTNIFRSLI